MTGSEVEFNLAQGLTIESPMERHRTTLRNERSGSILNHSSHSGDLPLRRGVGPALVPPALYATSTSLPGVDTISYLSWKAWALLLSRRPSLSPPQDWLCGEKGLDHLVQALDHDGWWSAF